MDLLRYVEGMLLHKTKFVEPEVSGAESMQNKDLISLHSIRPGEIRWAFDRYGCAFFYMVEREGHELKEKALYVERKVETKVEDDEIEFVRSSVKQA